MSQNFKNMFKSTVCSYMQIIKPVSNKFWDIQTKYFLSLWSWSQAYPSKPFLLIPAWDPRAPAAELFNRQHQRTRKIIEDTFGRWKYTWRFAPVYIAGVFIFLVLFYKKIPCMKKTPPVVTYIAVPAYNGQQFMFVLLAHNIVQQQVLSPGGKFCHPVFLWKMFKKSKFPMIYRHI